MEILYILLLIIVLETSYLTAKSLPYARKASYSGAVFIDTSVLLDGRILTIARTGFMPSRVIVPKSVIGEMHLLADQADSEKRQRARQGLDVLAELQSLGKGTVHILDDGPTGTGGVDERLIELAKKYTGSICTIDFNLNKVATVQGITVLNINELASTIRMAFLPGETVMLHLGQKGQDADQAVGYLADGTMVVVEKAASLIGQNIEVEVIRSLQTAAGRMMFAKPTTALKQNKPTKTHVTKHKTGRSQRDGASVSKARKKPTNEDSLIELVNNQ